jgi:hypothetical protein
MKPIDVLMQEHRVIEGTLDALETAANRLEHGESVRPHFFIDARRRAFSSARWWRPERPPRVARSR